MAKVVPLGNFTAMMRSSCLTVQGLFAAKRRARKSRLMGGFGGTGWEEVSGRIPDAEILPGAVELQGVIVKRRGGTECGCLGRTFDERDARGPGDLRRQIGRAHV